MSSIVHRIPELVARAAHGSEPAANELAALTRAGTFPWTASFAALEAEELLGVACPFLAERAPVNLRLAFEQAVELHEAREIIWFDRARRVRTVLEAVGVEGRVLPRRRAVVVVTSEVSRTQRVLQRLEPTRSTAPPGRVNRLHPPPILVVDDEAKAPARTWLESLWAEDLHVPIPPDPTPIEAPTRAARPSLPPTAREILAIRPGGLGDVLFLLPALEDLKERYPAARLVLQCDPSQHELLRLAEAVDEVEPFDWEVGTNADARSRFAARANRADLVVVVGPLLPLREVSLDVPLLELRSVAGRGHTAQQLLDETRGDGPTRGTAGAAATPGRFQLPGPAERTRRVALIPGASHVLKMWPIERFADLANALDTEVAAYGYGAYEDALLQELQERAPNVILRRGLSWVELLQELATCRLAIGNDSGPTHLATCVGTPTVMLHGPTDPTYTGGLFRCTDLGGAVGLEPRRLEAGQRPTELTIPSVEDVLGAVRGLPPGE